MTSEAPERGFGIVGTGVIAAMHAAAIATVPRARLVAVTDVADGPAAAFAAARGCAAEPGLDQLLARPDVDVVCVCVPSGLHAEVGVQTVMAGKHLVVEKPIDVTLTAADRLIEAARAAGVALTVISQHRFGTGAIGALGAAADPAAIEVASHAAQIADLLAAIEEGRAPAVDGQAGRDALEIVRAVYSSARTGRTVRLTNS